MQYELPGDKKNGDRDGALAARIGWGVGAIAVIALLFGFARTAYQTQNRQVAPITIANDVPARGVAPASPVYSPPITSPPVSGGGGIAPASAPYLPPISGQTAPPPLVTGTTTAARADEAARDRASASVRALRETFTDIQKFDQERAWSRSGNATPRRAQQAAVRPEAEADANASANAVPPLERSGEAAEPAIAAAPGVYDQLDALSVNVALYGHPGRFPAPLRNLAGEAAGEMRVYLKTAEAAQAPDNAEEQDALRAAAAAHLARAGKLTAELQAKAKEPKD